MKLFISSINTRFRFRALACNLQAWLDVFKHKSSETTLKVTNFLFTLLPKGNYNSFNTTVTLSTLMGNAQPWRFFYACSGELNA